MRRLQSAVYSLFTRIDLIFEIFGYFQIFNTGSFSAVLCFPAGVSVCVYINLPVCCHTLSACAHARALLPCSIFSMPGLSERSVAEEGTGVLMDIEKTCTKGGPFWLATCARNQLEVK